MLICKECGVQLEKNMTICPLCDTLVGEVGTKHRSDGEEHVNIRADRNRDILRRVLWQVSAVLFLSGVVATTAIDLSVHGSITWSVYPVTVCLMMFSYACLLALWQTRVVLQVVGGWLVSILVLVGITGYTDGDWPVGLALPLLCAINIVGLAVYFAIRRFKIGSLNILSIFFVAIACLCLVIDGIISFYFHNVIRVLWSVIVAACLLPVAVAISFMSWRMRNNAILQRIFHT